jgi:hypothetical protein
MKALLNNDNTSYRNSYSMARMEVEEKEWFIIVSSHVAPAELE